MRKRTKQFVIRLNDDELNHLNKLVKASNLSRESYLRMCINGLVPKPSPSTELIETIGILRQIAESLSDISKGYISKMVNSRNRINEKIIFLHVSNTEEICDLMHSFLD